MKNTVYLSRSQILRIKSLRIENWGYGKIAKLLKISKGTVYRVCKNKYHVSETWKRRLARAAIPAYDKIIIYYLYLSMKPKKPPKQTKQIDLFSV